MAATIHWLCLIAYFGNFQSCHLYPEVILSSMDVYAMKTRATYSCSAADSIEANWFLNGSDYRDLNLTNITAFFFDRTNVGIFIFKYLTGVYNNTHIQCEAIFSTKPPVRSGNNKTLLIQGYLSSILNFNYTLTDNNLTLSWEAPFSLDIPRVHPDITYCVDISSSNETIHSQCSIYGTEFNYWFMNGFPQCSDNIAKVIPVNRVGNGSSTELRLESDEEYICTEAATTIIPTVSPRNQSMNSSSSSEKNISVMLANNSPDEEQIEVKKSPKSMVLVITIAPIAFVIVLLTAVVIVTCGVLGVWTVKLRKQNPRFPAFGQQDSCTSNRYYDVICNSTSNTIYEDINGKINKPSQIATNACPAYASLARTDCCQVQYVTPPFIEDSETSIACYETIPGEKPSAGSDIDTSQCQAYGTIYKIPTNNFQ